MSPVDKASIRWNVAAYVIVCLPMVLLMLVCVRDAYTDVQMIHDAALLTEISRLRSQAVRRAGQLEFALSLAPTGADWGSLRDNELVQQEWNEIGAPAGHDLYSAVVDPSGRVVMHTDPARVGQLLKRHWYEGRVTRAGPGVVRTTDSALTAESSALDVRVPLVVRKQEIGEYHEGLDANWFDGQVASMQREAIRGWLWLFALAVGCVVTAAWALYLIVRNQTILRHRAVESERERCAQLAEVASGLAHEIRNPLHALRLNLHALGKGITGKTHLTQQDLLDTVRESDLEINQLDSLLRDLIRYASPEPSKKSELNVVSEVQATLSLMQEDMRQRQIEVRSRWADQGIMIFFDPARLRQMLLNLLTFAQNNAGTKGTIDVEVNRRGELAEVVISDSGPPLSDNQVRHVFEPFHAPRETGSGLGLALVRAFAAEAGGSASCETNHSGGNRFRVLLPDTMPGRRR